MKNPEELYESVLGRVTDGFDVDWEALEARCPDLGDRWHNLRRVHELSTAFRLVREAAGAEATEPDGASTPAEVSEPLMWGPLRLGEKIGEGSFAEVYRAHDALLERDVALKLACGSDAPEHRRFLNEGRKLARLDHPGIVRVYGAAVHDGRAGMWMDLATGRGLDWRLAEDGRFAEAEVIDVARQLTSALGAVHAAGLVHGDVKAANVLRRDGGVLVLGDFGASVDLRFGASEAGSATPLNAAPEVLRGEPADERSDIYSLGVLLFNLLTGAFPFEGESLSEIRAAHTGREPARLRDLRPDVSLAFAALVDRAIEVDPARRWQSVRELAKAVEELGRGATKHVLRRSGRRSWLWAAALIVALVAGMALLSRTPSGELAFQLNVGLYRTGDATALRTGDRLEVGDALHLRLDGNEAPLWLYLVNEDDHGQVYRLFPLDGVEPSNPLPAGDLRLPGRIEGVEQDWLVTSEGRTESFLWVASRAPLPELETALAGLEGASANRQPRRPSTALPLRGVGGLGASVDATAPGTLTALREIALAGSGDLDNARTRVGIVTLRGGSANED